MQPYLATVAAKTGSIATVAGKGIYNYLTLGAGWLYDKFMNTVVPYTTEQLPKIVFIIKGRP